MTALADTNTGNAFGIEFLLFVCLSAAVYITPSVIAFCRGHPNRYAILVVNMVLGGTGLGWLGALIWALSIVHLPRHSSGSAGGESGLNLFANDTRTVRLISPSALAGHMEPQQGPSLSAAAAVAEIDKLGLLQAGGHLSEAEFTRLKRAVLNRLRSA